MRPGHALFAVACLMTASSGCAGSPIPLAAEADQRLRILSVDYDVASHRAVFEVCRVGEPAIGERGRVCQLGWAALDAAGDSVALTPASRRVGFQYTSAVLVPGGEALYASRRAIADWRDRLYDSPSQIVRINLADGSETEISRSETGLLTVADATSTSGGSEALVILETLPSERPQAPSNGSRFRLVQVRDGSAVEGSEHVLNAIGGAGYEMRVPGSGYIRQAEDRRDGIRSAMFAVRSSEISTGRYAVLPTLEAALGYVTGCEAPDCTTSPAGRRAHALAQRLTPEMKAAGYGPETAAVEFPDRSRVYFPDPAARYGSFALGYDLEGGAVAVPRGPQPDPARIPYTLFAGDGIPFSPSASGFIEAGAFARGWF